MLELSRWKIIAVVLAAVFGIVFTLPNFVQFLPADMRAKVQAVLPGQTLNLGLDLRGGSHLLYEVDTQALIKEKLTTLSEDIRSTLDQEQIASSYPVITGHSVQVQITDPRQLDQAMTAVGKLAQPIAGGNLGLREFDISQQPPNIITFTMSDRAATAEAASAVQREIEIIRKRVDALGTKEASITPEGTSRIVIEAPGESDPERLKAVIGKTAKLTFQMVDEGVSREDANNPQAPIPPSDIRLPSDSKYEKFVVVKKRIVVGGEDLTDAHLGFDQYNRPAIDFRFDSKGATRFADTTIHNLGKRFAIILDNRSISAPVIQSPITGGSGDIEGNFTQQEATDLSQLLKSGALPAPLNVVEQRTVGPELGNDAIKAGAISLGIGALAIVIFIILAYGLFGVFAVVALIVNILMILAFMSTTQATMTLPGIAGMILTLAVAVDANVLIYERMRDEQRTGHAAMAAADHGFRRALVSIIDANITTLISALIMFQFGVGPVRGFAWTLVIGVLTSVFTAVLITQVLIGWWFKVAKPKHLPI
jgi:preprotein translocase subunit SecD